MSGLRDRHECNIFLSKYLEFFFIIQIHFLLFSYLCCEKTVGGAIRLWTITFKSPSAWIKICIFKLSINIRIVDLSDSFLFIFKVWTWQRTLKYRKISNSLWYPVILPISNYVPSTCSHFFSPKRKYFYSFLKLLIVLDLSNWTAANPKRSLTSPW